MLQNYNKGHYKLEVLRLQTASPSVDVANGKPNRIPPLISFAHIVLCYQLLGMW